MEDTVSTDLSVAADCTRNELTRSNSDASSLTVESSRHNNNGNARSGKFTTWTDEKHNLYLEYLEASFVNQLQQTICFRSQCSELKKCGSHLSRKLPVKSSNSSKQFSILQDAHRENISFGKKKPPLKTSTDTNIEMETPSACHCRCGSKSCNLTSADSEEYYLCFHEGMHLKATRSSYHGFETYSNYQGSVVSNTEFSDQNFVDGDKEEEQNSSSRSKRLKIAVEDASS